MKITNKTYESLGDLHQNLTLENLTPENTLIQVFSGLISEFEIKQIQTIFQDKNNKLPFIGTTTAGEIYNGLIHEKSIVVSIIKFQKTTLEYHYNTNNNDYKMGQDIAQKLFKDDTKAMIIFIDGLLTNGSDVLDGISSINNTIPIAGGLSGDNGAFKETFVFNETIISNKGSVAVSLNSKILNIFTNYQLNWQPIGEYMTITKATKNRLYEINGIPASDIYRKYLGNKVGDGLPFSATEFPLLKIESNGLEVCRTFTHKFEEDGSLLTIGNLEVGDKVRFSFGNVDLIINESKHNLKEYIPFHPEVIFTYNCTARKAFLQSNITVELKLLNQLSETAGFFTYGEIYHQDDTNSLLNISLTVLALSENENIQKNFSPTEDLDEDKNFLTNKHFLVLDALTNLSNTVIEELHESNKKLTTAQENLQILANQDYLTNLYNSRYLNEIAEDYIILSKRENKTFSIIILDIDNFKKINDTYGHAIGDEVIKSLASLLKKQARESDIIARLGGDEFVILLPYCDKTQAYKIAETLRSMIEKHTIVGESNIQFSISLGVDCLNINIDNHLSQVLVRADNALYIAKRNGKNKVHMNP